MSKVSTTGGFFDEMPDPNHKDLPLGGWSNAPSVTRDGRMISNEGTKVSRPSHEAPVVGSDLRDAPWPTETVYQLPDVAPQTPTHDAPQTPTHGSGLEEEQSEEEREQLRLRMADWMENNGAMLGLVQRVALAIVEAGLLDKRRQMPYNMLQMTKPGEEPTFCMAVHLDHPLYGHASVLFVQDDLIEFMPENTFFYDVYTAKSEDAAVAFIKSLATEDLTKIQYLDDLVEKRALTQINVFVRDLLRDYHTQIDLEVRRVKQFLSDTPCVEFLNPKLGFMKDTVRIAANIDERLFLSDPTPFYVAGDEAATEFLRDRLKVFRDLELKRASLLYAAQKLCTNGGYHVYVHKRVEEQDVNALVARTSPGYIDANPGKDRARQAERKGAYPVNVNPDGSVAVVMVINAERIEIKSPLQI